MSTKIFYDTDLGIRVLWWFDAGIDTHATAVFLGVPEHVVASVLADERATRSRARRAKRQHFEKLHVAWSGDDIDRHGIALRFGYRDARAASAALSHWRGAFGLQPRAARAA